MNWPAMTAALMRGEDLSAQETRDAMDAIMSGEVSPVKLAGFLVALHAKGETVDELRALADVMVEYARPLEVEGLALDIVGTGGDMAHTVNISTMASLVCAGAGVRVTKHGNRASSSSTGTADVLEALGVDLATEPQVLQEEVQTAPMTFLFAQVFHPAMRHAAAARRELGVPTAFNFLGPLTNPARPQVAAVGCANASLAPVMAGVFAERGTDAAVFRGDDGLDELTLTTTSTVHWVHDGEVEVESIDPVDLGLENSPLSALRGGEAAENADVVRRLLAGDHGPVRDAVLLNAALALILCEQARTGDRFAGASTLEEAMRAGMQRAAASIDSGAAAGVLDEWVERSSVRSARS